MEPKKNSYQKKKKDKEAMISGDQIKN